MDSKEFDRHIKEGIPFVVYPDAIMWDPKEHPGKDAHEVYRELISTYRLAVNLETVEEFNKKKPADLIRVPREHSPLNPFSDFLEYPKGISGTKRASKKE